MLVFVCSDLLFGFLEFVDFKLKYVLPKSKARINPYLTFLSRVCYLFFQAIHNLHMTHREWEGRGFVTVWSLMRWAPDSFSVVETEGYLQMDLDV